MPKKYTDSRIIDIQRKGNPADIIAHSIENRRPTLELPGQNAGGQGIPPLFNTYGLVPPDVYEQQLRTWWNVAGKQLYTRKVQLEELIEESRRIREKVVNDSEEEKKKKETEEAEKTKEAEDKRKKEEEQRKADEEKEKRAQEQKRREQEELKQTCLTMEAVVRQIVNKPEYQPGGGTTKCNYAADEMLTTLGRDTTKIKTTDKDGYPYYKAIEMTRRAADQAMDGSSMDVDEIILAADCGQIVQVDAMQAQEVANRGVPVLGGSMQQSHVVVVIPDMEDYAPERGPRIAQCGKQCDIFYTKNGYGGNWGKEVVWFVLPVRR